MFQIVKKPINTVGMKEKLWKGEVGAISIFEGVVRNINDGKTVRSLEYECYENMAIKEGQRILQQALEKYQIIGIQCQHRVGHLNIGDIAIGVVAVSQHRKDAIHCCDWVVDQVKKKVPIWKKEHYLDRVSQWIYCPQCKEYQVEHL